MSVAPRCMKRMYATVDDMMPGNSVLIRAYSLAGSLVILEELTHRWRRVSGSYLRRKNMMSILLTDTLPILALDVGSWLQA